MKKEYRQISLAVAAAVIAFLAYQYLRERNVTNSKAPLSPASSRPTTSETTQAPSEVANPSEDSQAPSEAPVTDPSTVTYAPAEIDEYSKQQEILINEFKNRIQLNIQLPGDMRFEEADVEGEVAVLQGTSKDKKMAVLAVAQTPSVATILTYLDEQKNRITILGGQPFKIVGDTKTYPGPDGSGISKMTVLPGGTRNGTSVQAALLERKDKKGSYLLIMEANKSYFENADGDFDNMVDSLAIK